MNPIVQYWITMEWWSAEKVLLNRRELRNVSVINDERTATTKRWHNNSVRTRVFVGEDAERNFSTRHNFCHIFIFYGTIGEQVFIVRWSALARLDGSCQSLILYGFISRWREIYRTFSSSIQLTDRLDGKYMHFLCPVSVQFIDVPRYAAHGNGLFIFVHAMPSCLPFRFNERLVLSNII